MLSFWIHVAVFSVSAALLGSIWLGIWTKCLKVENDTFERFRNVLTFCVLVYAIFCIIRVIIVVAIPRTGIPDSFVAELALCSMFWLLIPPVWFFVEYYAVDSKCVNGRETADDLQRIKIYADYSAKMWAGVVALLLGLIALSKQ